MAEQKRFRRLFVGYEDARSPREQRSYVRDEIIRMLGDGDFLLTECMNQRPHVRQVVGDVIFGHGVSDGSDGFEKLAHVTSYPVAQQIADARITIEAVDGKRNIRYVDGVREVEGIIVGSNQQFAVPQFEDNVIDLGAHRTQVGLRAAWLILKHHGEYVVRADLAADRTTCWLYREVPPKAEQPKRGAREDRAMV